MRSSTESTATESKPAGRTRGARRSRIRIACMLGSFLCFGLVGPFAAADEDAQESFVEKLDRVNSALRTNPAGVSVVALESCEKRRRFAAKLYQQSYTTRAERSLAYCFDVLRIPRTAPRPPRPKGPDMKAIAAQSAREVETALALEPNLDNGLEVYRDCALCHMPEGWGMKSGLVPQLAGQHKEVIIKQLADIRAGNREAHLMLPYASVDAIGGPQAVADVAAYIDTLEISTDVGRGPGKNLDVGETLYAANCAGCHGDQGQGNPGMYAPRIQSQHFKYLVRQFELIREGKRKNANPEMQTLIKNLDQEQAIALLDYISRLEPPEEMQAPPGWFNPDFEAPPEPLAGVRPPR